MRFIQIAVPEDQRAAFVEVLEERDLGYTVTAGLAESSDRAIISFVVPADAVEYVLDDLEAEGFDTATFAVSVETEYAAFEGIDEVQDRWAKTPNRIAPESLRSKAKDLRLNTRSYLWMMVLSTVIATAGLLMGSPAVVVGSMVLAPIVSPMLTASVGAVRDDRQMLLDSLQMQGLGLAVAILAAFVCSLVSKAAVVVPTPLDVRTMELVAIRVSPGLLGALVGLAAGAAGSFGLATKGQVSIVGVMIAAALIPTAAASGIGLAWGHPAIGIGSIVLLVTTIVAVNLGGILMFAYLGYRPDDVDEGLFDVSTGREVAVLAATAAVVVALVIAVGLGTADQVRFERSVNTATTDVLERDTYEGLGVTSMSAEYVGAGPFSTPVLVSLTLSRSTNREYPGLPAELARAIRSESDEWVTVRVQYQDYDRSDVQSGSQRSGDSLELEPATQLPGTVATVRTGRCRGGQTASRCPRSARRSGPSRSGGVGG